MFGSHLTAMDPAPNGRVLACPGLVIARFWADTRGPEIEILRRGFETAASDKIVIFLVIDADASAPAREQRDELGRLFGNYNDSLAAWAASVSGTGLAATSKRTMMRVIMALGRIRCPWVVRNDPGTAAEWLAEETRRVFGEAGNCQAWLAAIDSARRRDGA